jgi:hypothetical protein
MKNILLNLNPLCEVPDPDTTNIEGANDAVNWISGHTEIVLACEIILILLLIYLSYKFYKDNKDNK